MKRKISPPSSRSVSHRLVGRIAREQEAKRQHDAALIALAAEPVPLGSGVTEVGRGSHLFIKLNPRDASVRFFRFRDVRAARDAIRVA